MAANVFDQFDQQAVNPFDQFDSGSSKLLKKRTFGETAQDIAASVVSGAGSLVQLPGQLYGLATGDLSDTGALGLGKDISKYGEEMKSAGLKAREAERAEKIKAAEQTGQWEAFKTAFGETVKDPALLTSFLAEQAPQLLVPFGAAKVAQIGTAAKAAVAAQGLVGEAATKAAGEITKAAAERGVRAAIGAGAAQQGADVGAQAYEDIYKELKSKGATDADAAQGALNLARAAGASGALISLLAQRLPGARTLEESFAGVPGTGGRLLGAAKGALGEGASEIVEEAGGKFGANLAMQGVKPEQSLLEGLGQTAGMAAVGGVGMGGVTGLARRHGAPEAAKPEAAQRKPKAPEEPQPVEAAAPEAITGEAGIARPEEEVTPLATPQDIQAEAPAPSPVVGESPASTRVEEGRAVRPEAGVEPSIAEDRQRAEPVEPVVEPVKPAVLSEEKRGATTRIIAGKEKIPAQWEVVEADSVKAAMTEGKTQPRDRQRAVSNAQIMSIAQDPDFDRLSDTSQTMDYGAPTLTQDGAIVGGNGRFEGVNLSYDTDAGQRYKQALVENAERLGLDPEQVGTMKKPILVRRITQPADTRKLAIQSNIVAGIELSDMEQAALDAERMAGLDMLEISETGDIPVTSRNMDVIRSAFKDYTTEEMGKMMSAEGGLSQAGLRRVRNAILYKAYGKTDTLSRLVESPGPDLKNVGTALMRASGDMSKMMDAIRSGAIPAEYDIIEDLTGAIETLSSLRASGTKVQEFLAQTDMFGDGISGPARAILRFMDNNLRSAKSITEFLNDYAQSVLSAESATGGLFGEVKLPTKQETVERAAQKYEAQRAAAKAQRTLEEQPASEVRPEGRVQPEGEGRAAVSDEEATKINEQQTKDAGTPPNITEAIDEHAFGKQVGAEPFTETKVKGQKAYFTSGMRQAPNKELGQAIKEESTSGVIEQLSSSNNPIISAIGKLAKKRPWFGVGMMSYFPDIKPPKEAKGFFATDARLVLMRNKTTAESEHVVAHEVTHFLTWSAISNPTEAQKPAVQRLKQLFDHVKKNIGNDGQKLYGLTSLDEFIAEANSNVNFQYKLRQIKYQNQTAWGAFTKYVAQLLGLGNDTALTEIIALTEELASPESRTTVAPTGVGLAMQQDEKTYRGAVGKELLPTPTTAGQSALDTINQLGMGVKEPEKNLYQKAKDTFKQMGESPAGTKAEIKEAVRKFFANTESKVFSPDARWDSDIKNGLRKDMKPIEDIIGASLLVSQSQAVGPDAVATRAMLIGGAKYDAEAMKWMAYENKDANEVVKAKVLDDISAKYGLTREEASQVAHTYLVAANYEGILNRNEKLQERIKKLNEEGKTEEADDLEAALVFVSEDQAEMVEPGKAIADSIPEVKKITEIWNEQRRMVKDAMVFGGLWTPEYADALMDNAAYVPFYREKQIEADEGPRVFMRGLQVKAKEQKLKGSKTAVNDVFENMALWQQYALNRAIRNHKMVQSIDVGKTIQVGDRKMAEQVKEPKRGMNVVRLWRNGKQEFYEVADPYYVEAFQSLGAVYIEPIKYFTAISNILRKTVVMYPLFSLGQLTQDSVAAIFASGLKPQYAFKIPFLAVQEFIKTMKGWSTTHDELAKYGVVGVRDFNATVARQDAEITAGIKAPPGTMGKINYMLERIAMSADNAVRQATYIASTDAGLSKAESLEKAFEIINFRRRGSSKLLNLMGQTVPFFYAYLSAQRVAYKTLTLSGISPTERKAALETLAQTTAAVMALSFLYAMANGDDEEYKKTPATVRDRSLIIPGSGGVRIPLRPDFFLFPKVIAEHTYQLITDKGYSDGAKFRKSMADLFANATLSPNPVPQLIKPTLEAGINYSFFEGKPIIGFFEQNKEAGRQFSESTSEFAKYLGRFGASPQMVDHLVRGYFGSVGGLTLWGTNFFIEGEPGVPRPELTAHDMITTMPGVGAFRQKPTENALKVDFYELRDAIAKAKNTYDDMKVRSPEGLESFLQDEKNLARLAMDKQITKIGDHLSKIRRAIQQVAAAPAERMSASEKQEKIKELRDVEMELLKAVDVKAMRAQAKL